MTFPGKADQFTMLPGFKAQLVRSATAGEGSWISMTVDQKGRFIISPQSGTGNMLRLTLSPNGDVVNIETILQPVGSAMGLLYAFDGLYVNGTGPSGTGLYRLHYNRATDLFDSVKLLREMQDGSGEHGTHAIVLGKDKHLYVISGNFTKLPKDLSVQSPHQRYAEDQLLPSAEDGNGFGAGHKPPGGFLLRMDMNGQHPELICGGMRNTYDFAINPDGEMFGFDSDMEWDFGLPWYRPTRLCHLVSGADFGFREGSGKFPAYYPDSLPPVLDVGIGSPTGMKFGTDSKFPGKYKNALYMLDWAYGRIFAVHLTPRGASYVATSETILRGKPLNLTDIEFGRDGAMYFITGGRGTASGLYRVTYVGPEPKPELGLSRKELRAATRARELRRKLEAFHGKENRKAVAFAWPCLNSEDRFIRYAARIAIESQPIGEWQRRALTETNANAALGGLLALARCGPRETQEALLHALAKFPFETLTEDQQIRKLRVMELSFIRQGLPDKQVEESIIKKLSKCYPAKSQALNRELCELLVYLHAPDVVEKTLALLDSAPTQEEQIWYVMQLRNLKSGWTSEECLRYFGWFQNRKRPQTSPELVKWFKAVDRDYADGSSFSKFIDHFKSDALAALPNYPNRIPMEPAKIPGKPHFVAPPNHNFIKDKTSGMLSSHQNKPVGIPMPPAKPTQRPNVESNVSVPNRKFIQDWKMSDFIALSNQLSGGRSLEKGREVFTQAKCAECHRFNRLGGAVGPELTAISSRFGHQEILESILEPSRVISEQYQNIIVVKKDGESIVGRLVVEDGRKLVLNTSPFKETKEEIMKADVDARRPSNISPMPEGLMNTFTKSEILDLIAYLESGGKGLPRPSIGLTMTPAHGPLKKNINTIHKIQPSPRSPQASSQIYLNLPTIPSSQ